MSASAKSQGVPADAEPDVLVIGGGIAGLWCGYFLRRAGLAVTVLDRAPVGDPAACSSGNTGFLGGGGVAPGRAGAGRGGRGLEGAALAAVAGRPARARAHRPGCRPAGLAAPVSAGRFEAAGRA